MSGRDFAVQHHGNLPTKIRKCSNPVGSSRPWAYTSGYMVLPDDAGRDTQLNAAGQIQDKGLSLRMARRNMGGERQARICNLSQIFSEIPLKRKTENSLLIISVQLLKRHTSEGPPGFTRRIHMKSHELDDIIRVNDDVRYDYDRSQAADYLIRPIISGGEPKWQ